MPSRRRKRPRRAVKRVDRKPHEWPTVDGTVLTPAAPRSILRARAAQDAFKARR